jgi:hypothetical protein
MDEIFWLAGLLEAEGSFVAAPPSDPKRPRISLAMTDADIVERVSRLFGGTAIQQQAGRVQGWKATYRTLVGNSRLVSPWQASDKVFRRISSSTIGG